MLPHILFTIMYVFTLFSGDDDDIWLRYESYKDADVIIMCFSIDNPAALTIIEEKWFPEVKLNCPTGSSNCSCYSIIPLCSMVGYTLSSGVVFDLFCL